jgi:prefoldin alpha subunit
MEEEIMFKLHQAHEQSKDIEGKMQIVEQQISELQKFGQTLSDLGENPNKEILAPLGKGVFIKSDIKDDKLFVDVGSGVLLKKSVDEAKNIIEEQKNRLNGMKTHLIMENDSLAESMRGLIEEAEKSKKVK